MNPAQIGLANFKEALGMLPPARRDHIETHAAELRAWLKGAGDDGALAFALVCGERAAEAS